jgi:RNase P/RNase MRP subunit POP5
MNNGCMERNRCLNYKIIIPQEEPKQETLEEYIKKVTKNFGD